MENFSKTSSNSLLTCQGQNKVNNKKTIDPSWSSPTIHDENKLKENDVLIQREN